MLWRRWKQSEEIGSNWGGEGPVLDGLGGVGASLRSWHLSRDLNKVKDKICGYQAGEQREERPWCRKLLGKFEEQQEDQCGLSKERLDIHRERPASKAAAGDQGVDFGFDSESDGKLWIVLSQGQLRPGSVLTRALWLVCEEYSQAAAAIV